MIISFPSYMEIRAPGGGLSKIGTMMAKVMMIAFIITLGEIM